MNKLGYLALGCLLGGLAVHFLGTARAPQDRQAAHEAAAGPWAAAPAAAPTSAGLLPAPVPVPAAPGRPEGWRASGVGSASLAAPLIDKLAADTDHAIDSEAYKDLACLMRQDRGAVAQVRARLLDGASPNERQVLVRLLAADGSAQTGEFLAELVGSPDTARRRLGLDLLQASDAQNGSREVARALVQASLMETDPENLADILTKLTEQRLDSASAAAVAVRMQALMNSPYGDVRAQALGVLARQTDPTTLSMTVKRSLLDPDADVRVAAASTALRLPPEQLDNELLGALARLSQSATETDAVRQLAAAVLARRSPP